MLPHLGVLVVVVFRGQATERHHEGGCIAGLALAPVLQYVVIETQGGDVVFDSRNAVSNQVHVHMVERAALCHGHHTLAAGRLNHHLALVAARLVVVLDGNRALGLEPANVCQGIVECLHRGVVGGFCAVDDLCCGKNTRSEDASGAGVFGGSKYQRGLAGRVVHSGNAQCQVSQ